MQCKRFFNYNCQFCSSIFSITNYVRGFLQFLALVVLAAVASAAEKKTEDLKTEESHQVASYGSG